MRVALGQFGASHQKEVNLRHMQELTADARRGGAELVLFPELSMADLHPGLAAASVAEALDGPFVAGLAKAARTNGIAIVAGIIESIPSSTRAYNTAVAVASDGSMLGH